MADEEAIRLSVGYDLSGVREFIAGIKIIPNALRVVSKEINSSKIGDPRAMGANGRQLADAFIRGMRLKNLGVQVTPNDIMKMLGLTPETKSQARKWARDIERMMGALSANPKLARYWDISNDRAAFERDAKAIMQLAERTNRAVEKTTRRSKAEAKPEPVEKPEPRKRQPKPEPAKPAPNAQKPPKPPEPELEKPAPRRRRKAAEPEPEKVAVAQSALPRGVTPQAKRQDLWFKTAANAGLYTANPRGQLTSEQIARAAIAKAMRDTSDVSSSPEDRKRIYTRATEPVRKELLKNGSEVEGQARSALTYMYQPRNFAEAFKWSEPEFLKKKYARMYAPDDETIRATTASEALGRSIRAYTQQALESAVSLNQYARSVAQMRHQDAQGRLQSWQIKQQYKDDPETIRANAASAKQSRDVTAQMQRMREDSRVSLTEQARRKADFRFQKEQGDIETHLRKEMLLNPNLSLATKLSMGLRGQSGRVGTEISRGFWGGGVSPDLGQQLGQAGKYSLLYGGYYAALSQLSRGLGSVKEDVFAYEAALTDLEIASGRSREQLSGVATAMGNLATAAGFGQAEGVAAGARAIGLYGVSDKPAEVQDFIQKETVGVSSKIARISGVQLEEAQQKLAAITKAFHLSATQSTEILDQFVVIARNTGQSVPELMDAAANVGTLAQTGGFDLPSTAAIIAQITPQAGSPGAASGALRQVMSWGGDKNFQKRVEAQFGVEAVGKDLYTIIKNVYAKSPDRGDEFSTLLGRGGSQSAAQTIFREFLRIQELSNKATSPDSRGAGEKYFQEFMGQPREEFKKLIAQIKALGTEIARSGILHAIGALVPVLTLAAETFKGFMQVFNLIPEQIRAGTFMLAEAYAALVIFGGRAKMLAPLRAAGSLIMPARLTSAARVGRDALTPAVSAAASAATTTAATKAASTAATSVAAQAAEVAAAGVVTKRFGANAAKVNLLPRKVLEADDVLAARYRDAITGFGSRVSGSAATAVKRAAITPVDVALLASAAGSLKSIPSGLRAARVATVAKAGEALTASRAGIQAGAAAVRGGAMGARVAALATRIPMVGAMANPYVLAGAALAAGGVGVYKANREAAQNRRMQSEGVAGLSSASTADQINTGRDQLNLALDAVRKERSYEFFSKDTLTLGLTTLWNKSSDSGAAQREKQLEQQIASATQRAEILREAENKYNRETVGTSIHDFSSVEMLNEKLNELAERGYNAAEQVQILNSSFQQMRDLANSGNVAVVKAGESQKYSAAMATVGSNAVNMVGELASLKAKSVDPYHLGRFNDGGRLRDIADKSRNADIAKLQIEKAKQFEEYITSTGRDVNSDLVMNKADEQKVKQLAEEMGLNVFGQEDWDHLKNVYPEIYRAFMDGVTVNLANANKQFGGGVATPEQALNALVAAQARSEQIGKDTALQFNDQLAGLKAQLDLTGPAVKAAEEELNKPNLTQQQRDELGMQLRNAKLNQVTTQREYDRLSVETAGAQELANISPGNTRARIQSQRATALKILQQLNPATKEYADMSAQIAEYNSQLRQNLLDYYAAFDLNQVGIGDTVGQAQAAEKDAQRRMDEAFQYGDAAAQEQAINAARQANARRVQEQVARNQAQAGALVDPGDTVGQALLTYNNVIDNLFVAGEMGDLTEVARLTSELKKATQDVISAQIEVANAIAVAKIDPRDQAALIRQQLNDARTRLANTPTSNQKQYADIANEINQLQLKQNEYNVERANAMMGARYGTSRSSLVRAATAIAQASNNLDLQKKGTAEYYRAQEALIKARQEEQDLIFQGSVNQIDANAGSSDSQLVRARGEVEKARQTLNRLVRGTPEWWAQLAQLNQTKQALSEAEIMNAATTRKMGVDMTNQVQMARETLREALDRLRNAKSAEARKDATLGVRQAQSGLEQSQFQQWLGDLQTDERLGRIGHQAYLQHLQARRDRLAAEQALAKATDNGFRQRKEQIDQIDLILKETKDALSQGQWNIGDVKVPTIYEVRRAIAEKGGRDNTGAGVVNNNNQSVTVNGADFARVVEYINGILGQPATRIRTIENRKV